MLHPLETDPISPDWIDNCLRKGSWTAALEGWIEVPKAMQSATDDMASFWSIVVGGYSVSNQPPINNKLPHGVHFGSSITYIIYFDSKVYAQRLAQRALDLWIVEYADREEKRKDDRIKKLEAALAAYQKENDSLWKRYLVERERTATPNLSS